MQSILRRGSLRADVLVLLLGTVIGQALPMLASPILTRLYRPDEFGVLGVFSAICMSLVPVATLRYEYTLLLARKDEDAAAALYVCAIAIVANSLLALLVVALLPFDRLFGLASFEHVKYFLPLALFFLGAYQVLVYEATRVGDFRPVARTKLIQGIAGPGIQILAGIPGLGSLGLVVGFICSQAAGSFHLLRRFILPHRQLIARTPPGRIATVARQYIRFPLLSSWSGMLQEAAGGYLAITMVMIFYDPQVAGFLFLADRVVGRPLLIVTTSTLQAIAGDFSKLLRERPSGILRRFVGVVSAQFLIAALWCGLVAAAVPFIVVPVFGQTWAGAVPIIQVICIAYLFQATMHAVSPMLQIMERQGLIACWEVFRCSVVVSSFAVPAFAGYDALFALSVYACAQAAMQIAFFCIQLVAIRRVGMQNAVPAGGLFPERATPESGLFWAADQAGEK